ncbi:MAG: LuxR family transcriptional regulator [Pseudomonas sp.]
MSEPIMALLDDDLQALPSFEACLDRAHGLARALGFQVLVYDYAPVPRGLDGELITPAVFEQRAAPLDMRRLWCERGYYQRDPVQAHALRSVAPFAWSYRAPSAGGRCLYLGEAHPPLTRYLCESGLDTGLTVPLHLPGGGLATFTGIRTSGTGDALAARQRLAGFVLLAQVFQARAQELLPVRAGHGGPVRLTRRERECLQYSAKGLTAKSIAVAMNRSVATVNLHLNSAARKLGARNRVEAVVHGLHYRLIEP